MEVFSLQVIICKPIENPLTLSHYMYPGPFGSSLDIMRGSGLRASGPRLVCAEPVQGWQECKMTVSPSQVGHNQGRCHSHRSEKLHRGHKHVRKDSK